MNKTNTTAVRNAAKSMMETMEGRQLRSATPAVVAYLPSYEMDNAVVANLRNNNFRGITQVNFFNLLPTDQGVLPGTSVDNPADADHPYTNTDTTTASGDEISGLTGLVSDAHNANVKVSFVIGGAGTDSDTLDQVVNGGWDKWNNLAQSIKQFAGQYGVDGVDIDWEPASLADTDEKAAYGDMLTRIKEVNPALQVSAAVAGGKHDLDTGGQTYILDADAVKALDQVMVMNYDLEIGNVSPLSTATTVMTGWGNEITSLGGTKSEVIYGLPFYGTTGTTWKNTTPETYSELIRRAGYVPSASSNSIVVGGQTYNYNGPQTIYTKTDNAIDNGFGGVGIWSVGQDYLKNGQYDSTYSLLPQITKAIADNAGSTTIPTTPTSPTEPTIPNAQLSATVTSSSPSYRNWQANKAVDGDLNTYFQGNTAGSASKPEWVTLDFGSAKVLSKVQYAARQDARWTMAGGVFQASNTADFSNAVDLFSLSSTPAAGLQSHTVSGTYRYVRYLAPIGSYGNIAEFRVFGHTPYTTSNVTVANSLTSAFSQSDKVITLVNGQQN